jgi:hypothetical protein
MGLLRRRFLVVAAVLELCTPTLQAQMSVTTYHSDNARTGQMTLTP